MASVPRVVYWDNLPAPYAVERYNTLAARANIDLSVWFARRVDPDRSWLVDEATWRFSGCYVEDPSRSLALAHRFIARCGTVRPDLILSLYGERRFVVGHAILKGLGYRTALLVLPTFDTWIRRAWWKEVTKAFLFRSADAAKVPGPDGLRYAKRYGFPEQRVFRVTQSTNVERYAAPIGVERRKRLREQLGVQGCVFIYVGRFLREKGLINLIEAFRQAQTRRPGMSLLLLGDGAYEGALRQAARGIDGVTFCPFVQAQDIVPYYAAADAFVFPTLGDPHGQVIEEAHAAGLPIITTDAAGDIRLRIEDGRTGFVVPAGNPTALARRMVELAADPDRRRSMGARGAERVKDWGHDTWAADFERFVEGALALPRRATFAARAAASTGHLVITAAGWANR